MRTTGGTSRCVGGALRHLRDAEIEQLADALFRDDDVGRLQIAVQHAALVRQVQRVGQRNR